ncbi:hypothetical protein [Treponema phagedenis]|uniref:hypothetical protein n=1 Tax=Treponema phagedenis TaxID=162 RepID=UPI0021CC99C8|nr:hypothetical protein [Treponema phagedenis]
MSDILNELVGENSKEVLEKKERLQKRSMIFFTFAKHTFRIIFHLSPRLIIKY